MKLSGIAGKGSGKLGSNVYAVSGGEQIVRQYNPVVANPSTPAQVVQRSRLKLASQIAAAMADVIAIPKSGLVSSRNAFMKRNFDLFVGSENGASCQYAKLQLTGSAIGLPTVNAEKSDAQTLSIELASSATAVASRIIYNVFAKTTEQQLMKIASRVVTDAGENGTFPMEVTTSATELVVYAYGMRDMSSTASAKYGNYHVQSGEDIAKLVANRKLSAADFTFTQTQGFDLMPWVNPFPNMYIWFKQGSVVDDYNSDDIVDGVLNTKSNAFHEIRVEVPDREFNVTVTGLDGGDEKITIQLERSEDYYGYAFPQGEDGIFAPYEVRVDGKLYFKVLAD